MASSTSMASIDPLEGLKGSRIIHYSRLQAFSRALQELKTALYDGKPTNQFLIVKGLDEKITNLIEERGYEGVRYEWHEDLQLLIVKVPTKAHEAASQEFGTSITDAVALMGLSPLERRVLGAGRFHAPLGAPRKEPD